MLILYCLAVLTAAHHSPDSTPPDSTERGRALHLLNRITFGPRPGDIDRVVSLGIDRFIDLQLAPESIDDAAMDAVAARFPVVHTGGTHLARLFGELRRERRARTQRGDSAVGRGVPQPATDAFRRHIRDFHQLTLLRAARSERQLYEVMVDFWANHFNVFSGKGPVRFLVRDHIEEVIRPHALGRFEDLLIASAQSPAMLVYLDNAMSVAPGSRPPRLATMQRRLERASRRPGGNTARVTRARAQLDRAMARMPTGLNENYARELLELHTLGVEGGYTQHDVTEVARIMTGWGTGNLGGPNPSASFVFNEWAHDPGEKTVLDVPYEPDGMDEGLALLRHLADHPATQRHVTARLCERFVSDTATEECIQSGTRAWRGTGGDIRAVIRAILTSPDFWSGQHRTAKTKTPLEFLMSAVRALDARPDSALILVQLVRNLGQPLYAFEAPTGYPETTADWVNAGALLNRLNVAMGLASRRTAALGVDIDHLVPTSLSPTEMIDAVNATILNGQATPNTLDVMAREAGGRTDPTARRAVLIGLALGSPEFQRQ